MLLEWPYKFIKIVNILLTRLLSDEIFIKFFGGIWKVRERANTEKNRIIRNIFLEIYYNYLSKYCCCIEYTAIFDNEPILPHGFFGIFISRHAKIGKDCVLFPHVVIGSNTLSDSVRKGSPKIGNNVFIGAGATIIGNVRIGNNCRIGSNCVVTCNVPDNSLVVMNKPRIITKLNMNNKFYTQSEDGCWRYNYDGEKIIETNENCINNLREIDIEWEMKKGKA